LTKKSIASRKFSSIAAPRFGDRVASVADLKLIQRLDGLANAKGFRGKRQKNFTMRAAMFPN